MLYNTSIENYFIRLLELSGMAASVTILGWCVTPQPLLMRQKFN
jgi:hypothetical protein